MSAAAIYGRLLTHLYFPQYCAFWFQRLNELEKQLSECQIASYSLDQNICGDVPKQWGLSPHPLVKTWYQMKPLVRGPVQAMCTLLLCCLGRLFGTIHGLLFWTLVV